jgi:hypothetical protein
MTLFNLDGSRQPAIGKRPWWRLFEVFQGSDLHAEFRARILPYSQSRQYLHSGELGSQILAEMEKGDSSLLQSLPREVVGPLFGMTLWNILATSADGDDWLFKKDPAEQHDFPSTEYFRHQREDN